MSEVLYDVLGRRRSPATTAEFHLGRAPRNKGQRIVRRPGQNRRMHTIACAHCGATFEPSTPARRFCSRRCGVTAAHAANRGTGTPWQDRFWDHLPADRQPDACWEWVGWTDPAGYGRLITTKPNSMLAHRASWMVHHGGTLPAETKVCHRCDNPPCVNPAHLFLGSQADNVADMHAKGRRASFAGTRNGQSKFSDEVIAEVKRMLADGMTPTPISRATGVSVSQIKHIRAGRARQT